MRRQQGSVRRAPALVSATFAAVVAAVLAGAGCAPDPYDGADGAPPPTSAVAGGPARQPVHVQARDNSFDDRDITIAAGTEVVWTNVGRNDHDVTPAEFEADATSAPWGATPPGLRPRESYSHVFDTPGVYAYLCTLHGARDKGMAGTITVTG